MPATSGPGTNPGTDCLSPYGTAYRRPLRTTRTRIVREGRTVRASDARHQKLHQVQKRLVDLAGGKLSSLRSEVDFESIRKTLV